MTADKPRILYVEDDLNLGFVTADNLVLQGFDVQHVTDGLTALQRFGAEAFDICVLDVMLPKIDGFELARRIRSLNDQVPILMLTARNMREDRLEGLRTGADDYITKPFSIEELVLKIRIFLKRSAVKAPEAKTPAEAEKYTCGKFLLDFANLKLSQPANPEIAAESLTLREGQLMRLLFRKPDVLIPREEILSLLWGNDDYFSGRSLDVFISRMRKYLKADPMLQVENVHKVGFMMKTR
ncbi:MAG: response regulator transcription factor [Bacteroidota bacterium]